MNFDKEDEILENPGTFCFRIKDKGNNFSYGKNADGYSDKIVRDILNNITQVFLDICKEIQHYSSNNQLYLEHICKNLNYLYNLNTKFNFPGLQVINITRNQLNYFSHWPERFLLCEKSDGVRYLLIQYHGGVCHLIGRNLEFFEIKYLIKLPTSYDIRYQSDWDIEYLLDGELVLDNVNETVDKSEHIYVGGKPKKLNFLVFDAVVVKGKNIGNLAFRKRLSILSDVIKEYEILKFQQSRCEEFIKTFNEKIEKDSFINTQKLLNYNRGCFINPRSKSKITISIYMKDYFNFNQVETIDKLKKYLPHHNDGIIINVDDYPYYSGQSCEIYKWKPLEMNTIDFEVKYNEKIKRYILYTEGKNGLIPVEILCFASKEEKNNFTQNFNKIIVDGEKKNLVECFYDNKLNNSEVLVNNYNLSKRKFDLKNSSEDSVTISNYIENFNNNIPKNINNLNGGWRFMRYRNDKKKANFIKVYTNILICIQENVQLSEIIDTVKKNKEIKLHDLEEEKNFMSSLVWKKFFNKNEKNESDYDDISYGNNIISEEKNGNIPEKEKENTISLLNKKRKLEKDDEYNYEDNINGNNDNNENNDDEDLADGLMDDDYDDYE